MQAKIPLGMVFAISIICFSLSSCATYHAGTNRHHSGADSKSRFSANYESRLPSHISTHEKTIIVDPHVHAWGAYNSSGNLIKAGVASAGSNWCPDLGRRCHTSVGTFRIHSLGGAGCISHIFPRPHGGAPMPYCMFFNGGQALHGVPPYEVGDGNYSHGCVRLRVPDAAWIRHNFATIGTKVIVRPY